MQHGQSFIKRLHQGFNGMRALHGHFRGEDKTGDALNPHLLGLQYFDGDLLARLDTAKQFGHTIAPHTRSVRDVE